MLLNLDKELSLLDKRIYLCKDYDTNRWYFKNIENGYVSKKWIFFELMLMQAVEYQKIMRGSLTYDKKNYREPFA